MSTPKYLAGLHIIKTWTHENVRISCAPEGEGFQHLVLVGRNGSGKTVTLDGLAKTLRERRDFRRDNRMLKVQRSIIDQGQGSKATLHDLEQRLNRDFPVRPLEEDEGAQLWPRLVHVPASRYFQGAPVNGPAAQDLEHVKERSAASFVQYLVNQRTEQAYAREEGDNERADRLAAWFANVERDLSDLLGEPFTLVFKRQPQFSFALEDKSGRQSPFQSLPSGWSALLGVFATLLLSYAAHGEDPTSTTPTVLLIDEPEVHLHPGLQWTVLPTLSRLFPGVQIIAATQSPIVAASLQGAVVYDLSNRQVIPHVFGGPPESVLLRAFGSTTRPEPVANQLRQLERVIDAENWATAKEELAAFANIVGQDDPDVVRLGALLSLSEALDSTG